MTKFRSNLIEILVSPPRPFPKCRIAEPTLHTTKSYTMLHVNNQISIPDHEFRFSYARSPGPGGQNVNKVNTKAILHWSVTETKRLPEGVRRRLVEQQKNRISDNGDLVISSHRFRDQKRNVADCLDKLKSMILAVSQPPRKRKRTKVPRAAKERRLENKRQKSQKKQLRQRVDRQY